jgi:hypothetical protein
MPLHEQEVTDLDRCWSSVSRCVTSQYTSTDLYRLDSDPIKVLVGADEEKFYIHEHMQPNIRSSL